MLEDLERDTCNFLILTLESLTGAWDAIKVIPIARDNLTIFQIELAAESLEQLLANNCKVLQAVQNLVSAKGMRQRRDFTIGIGGLIANATGDLLAEHPVDLGLTNKGNAG